MPDNAVIQGLLVTASEASSGNYVKYYQLAELPFCSKPDPRFVFASQSFSFASTRILQALQRREGLIVITGPSGVGKTALCRFVLQHLASSNRVSVITDPFLTADELLKHLFHDFSVVSSNDEKLDELPPSRTSPHDLVVALHRFLDSIASLGTTTAIVIDDAQHLQRRVLEQLRALSNLESDVGKLLQIVLIGEPQLDALLRRPEAYQLDHRVACRINLEPLSTAEVGRYVDFRLRVARAGQARSGRAEFSASALRMLTRVSGGIPRVLNALCDRSLEIGYERRAESITRRIVLQSARQLRLPIPLSARHPVVRDAAAALLAAALLGVPLIRLVRPLQKPWLAFVSQRKPAAPRPVAATAPGPALTSVLATKTAEPVAAAPPTPLQAADSYFVVVASFKSAHNAGAIAAQLEGFGLPAFAREDQTAGWHVVLVGPYASSEEAQDARRQLSAHNFPDSIVHLQRH